MAQSSPKTLETPVTNIKVHTSSLSNASVASTSDTRLLTPTSLSQRNSFDLRNSIHTNYGKSPVSLSPNDNVIQFDYNTFVTTWQDQIKMRQYEKCEKYCNEVIQKLLTTPDVTQKYRSKVHFSLAYLLKKYLKRYNEAKDEYFKSIECDKENPGAHFNLANMIVDHFKDYKLARIHFQKAIALEPLYAIYRMTYAEFLWHDMEKYQDAADQYEELISNQNDDECKKDADIHFNYGLLLRDYLKNIDGAVKEFKNVLKVSPNDAEAMEEYEYTLSLLNKDDNDEDKGKSPKQNGVGGGRRKTSMYRKSMHEHEIGDMIEVDLLASEEDEYAVKYHEMMDEKNKLMIALKEKEEMIKKLKNVNVGDLEIMVDGGSEYVEKNGQKVHKMLTVFYDIVKDLNDDNNQGQDENIDNNNVN